MAAPVLIDAQVLHQAQRRTPAITWCWPTGGTPVSSTCPQARGCWDRSRAAPPITPPTGSPAPGQIRDELTGFYAWCADHDDILEVLTLATTISRWQNEIIAAILTGVTNAKSEGLNLVAKLEARNAYSFRNAANQRRRVRTACTCSNRRRSPTATTRISLLPSGRRRPTVGSGTPCPAAGGARTDERCGPLAPPMRSYR